MILHEITLNLESLRNATLLLETKFSILKGNLSPNTIIGLKCVLGIWVLIIAGNLVSGIFEMFKKVFRRNRKSKPYREVIKEERRVA